MLLLRKPRWVAALVHGCVFVLTWVLYWLQNQPLLDGPSRWTFALIFFGDFPFSPLAFGKMWDGRKSTSSYAVAAWGIFGTMWWYVLGLLIEKGIRWAKDQRV